jgi:hypothetical protein
VPQDRQNGGGAGTKHLRKNTTIDFTGNENDATYGGQKTDFWAISTKYCIKPEKGEHFYVNF